jgi:pilus assembly protein TadC
MSDTVIVAIIAGLTTAIPAMLLSYLNHRALRFKVQEVKDHLHSVKMDVHQIEKATNGMKEALIVAARTEGHAQGVVDEKAKKANGT